MTKWKLFYSWDAEQKTQYMQGEFA